MNSLPKWANVLSGAFFALLMCGTVALAGWWKGESVPLWGYLIAAWVGEILWSRPAYNRPQDFDK